MPDTPDIREVLVKLTDMPALPTVVAKLTRLVSDPRATASDINAALSADPGLVIKILKLVNSAYYGFSRRITSITNAVVILGFNQVRNLALSAFVYDAFAKGAAEAQFDVDGFWRHSIGTAFVAARIARRFDPKMEEDAFICGILHDLGKMIMLQNAPGHLALVMNAVRRDDILFREAESKVLGYNHAVLGSIVMESWNLPEKLVRVVRHHHAPFKAPEEVRQLCCIVQTADIVARAMLLGNGGDAMLPRLFPAVWKMTGLDWETLEGIIHTVADEYSKSDAFFSIT